MVVDAIVVVGASTGGLHPLRRIIEALPHHCSAAVFVVMHSGAASSILPEILSWHSRVDVSFATDGGSIEAGRVYVAPPDRHMILELDHMWLTREPKVHATRPAADPLFASAATVYGDRVLGIVAHHPPAKNQPHPPVALPKPSNPSGREPFSRKPEGIANRRAQKHSQYAVGHGK